MSLNPNLDTPAEESSLLKFTKDQEYYENLEINMEDLDSLEARVLEMERYLGIDSANHDMNYFIKNDIEKID